MYHYLLYKNKSNINSVFTFLFLPISIQASDRLLLLGGGGPVSGTSGAESGPALGR